MKTHHYIFLSLEGLTYQPDSENCEPDIENAQVIGVAAGHDDEDAFLKLVRDNEYLLNTTFDEVYCYRLNDDHGDVIRHFSLGDYRGRGPNRVLGVGETQHPVRADSVDATD